MLYTKQLPFTDHRLGRSVEHDERSRAFAARRIFGVEQPQDVKHQLMLPPLNQSVGSCTIHTMLALNSFDEHWRSLTDAQKSAILADPEAFALTWYRYVTRNDEFPGAYEPDDTGSSGVSACKTVVHHGYANGYIHGFGLADAMTILNHKPYGQGTNWYGSMFYPSSSGEVKISAGSSVEGGHEYTAIGDDVAQKRIWYRNSWSANWGINGDFWMSWATVDRLLHEDGDVVALTPNDLPAPEPDWDLMLAKPLRDWAYSKNIWSRFTKAGKAATASREWLTRKGL